VEAAGAVLGPGAASASSACGGQITGGITARLSQHLAVSSAPPWSNTPPPAEHAAAYRSARCAPTSQLRCIAPPQVPPCAQLQGGQLYHLHAAGATHASILPPTLC
jgi:hypothetical protein